MACTLLEEEEDWVILIRLSCYRHYLNFTNFQRDDTIIVETLWAFVLIYIDRNFNCGCSGVSYYSEGKIKESLSF